MNRKKNSYLTREHIYNLFRIVVTLGLLTYLILYVEFETIYLQLQKANHWLIIIVVFMLIINLLFQFKKWQLVSANQLGVDDSKVILRSLFYGISAGILTPMQVGEYVARAVPFKNISIGRVTMAAVIDKFVPMIIILFVGMIVGDVFLISNGFLTFAQSVLLFFLFLAIAGTLRIIYAHRNSRFKKIYSSLTGIKWVKTLFANLETIKIVKGIYFVKLLALSFLFYLTYTTQFALLMYSFSGDSQILQFFFISYLVVFVQLIIPPIVLGGLGIREGAAVYFVQSFGMDPSIGFNAAVILFFINYIIPSIFGLYLINRGER